MNSKNITQVFAVIVLVALMAGLTPGVTLPVHAAPSDKSITAFNFTTPAAIGTINEAVHTITVYVPFGTNVTALVPTITHNGVSVSPSSGVAQDFTNPVTYTVTAADTSMQNYTVTVVIPITVTAIAGQNKVFGGVDPVFTYTSSNVSGIHRRLGPCSGGISWNLCHRKRNPVCSWKQLCCKFHLKQFYDHSQIDHSHGKSRPEQGLWRI